MNHTAFPYEVKLPDRPSGITEHKEWVNKQIAMSDWCTTIIKDHWGIDNGYFLFALEEDMNKFKQHFRI